MAYTFQGGPSDVWSTVRRVSTKDVIAVETDTKKVKVGDGKTRWYELPYIGGAVYPQFRVQDGVWQKKPSSAGAWEDIGEVEGRPGADGNVRPYDAEGTFFRSLMGNTTVPRPAQTKSVPEVSVSGNQLNTVPSVPQSGTAPASPTFASTVVGVNVSNDDGENDLTLTVNSKSYLLRPGKALTVMDYSGISTFSVAGSTAWAAVGLETCAGVV